MLTPLKAYKLVNMGFKHNEIARVYNCSLEKIAKLLEKHVYSQIEEKKNEEKLIKCDVIGNKSEPYFSKEEDYGRVFIDGSKMYVYHDNFC